MTSFPIRRNTVLLAATLTSLSGMVQLAVAVATVTLVLVTGIEGILGLGPAIFLTAGALAALPAGRLMDRHGRIPVLAGGCLAGITGCLTTALGCEVESAAVVVLGFALVGISQGTILLARAAAADMYPPERRGRGISYVLFGALFGAALGPLVFRPLFAGQGARHGGARRAVDRRRAGSWSSGSCSCSSSGPTRARSPSSFTSTPAGRWRRNPRRCARSSRRPGVLTALVAAVASFACMVAVMNLTGYLVIDHGHHQSDVFTVISLHIVGMYALVLVIGGLVDKVGRRPGQVAGLLVMGALHGRPGLVRERRVGVGVALPARARLEHLVRGGRHGARRPRACRPSAGKLIGLTDQVSSFTGAALVLLGGLAYSELGVEALAFGATAFVILPAVWILVRSAAGAPDVRPLSVK